MKLTIHIGSHKAGSTAIQKFCSVACDELAAKNVFYPVGLFPRYAAQHSELAALTRANADASLDAIMRQVAELSSKAGQSGVFLSGEDMCGCGSSDIERLHRAAVQHFEEVRIVLVLRSKYRYLISHYNHYLRHTKQPIGVTDFCRQMRFNPSQVLQNWQKHFGRENVLVVPYEAADGRPFLSRFFETVFDLSPSEAAIAKCRGVNASFDLVSALIVNEVLKCLDGFDLNKVNVAYLKTFANSRATLPLLEGDIGRFLSSNYPDKDWDIGSLDLLRVPDSPAPLTNAEAAAYLEVLERFINKVRTDLVTPAEATAPGRGPGIRRIDASLPQSSHASSG